MIPKKPPIWLDIGALLILAGFVLVARDLGSGKASTADWLAAMATVAAFLAAVYAAWYVARAYDIERNRDRARDDEAKRAQAVKIAEWHEPHVDCAHQDGRIVATGARMLLFLRNASDLPVHQITVKFFAKLADEGLWTYEVRADDVIHELVTHPIPTLPPLNEPLGEWISVPKLKTLIDETGRNADEPIYVVSASIEFTDHAGKRWRRGPTGVLEPVDEPVIEPLGQPIFDTTEGGGA